MPKPEQALPGRSKSMDVPASHFVTGQPLRGPFPSAYQHFLVGMGCFWGAERKFWTVPGVYTTAVGYAGGYTPNPSYEEVCSGKTGHNEVVLVVFDPQQVSFQALLEVFWESHNPTQGMRQGNDIGTQYRSAIYTSDDDQQALAEASLAHYQSRLKRAAEDESDITTEILPAPLFYYAEPYHQQYLAKNPSGYCGLGGCGVSYKK